MSGVTVGGPKAFHEALKLQVDAYMREHPVKLDMSRFPEQSCDCCGDDDYAPSTYTEVLEWNADLGSLPEERDEIDLARAAGDFELVELLEQSRIIADRTQAHCQAKLAKLEAEKRPGVMIGLDRGDNSVRGISGWIPTVVSKPSDPMGDLRKAIELARAQYLTTPEPAFKPAERTCSCGRVCDVGAPCWWCGNA